MIPRPGTSAPWTLNIQTANPSPSQSVQNAIPISLGWSKASRTTFEPANWPERTGAAAPIWAKSRLHLALPSLICLK